jgi:hypothetical protein
MQGPSRLVIYRIQVRSQALHLRDGRERRELEFAQYCGPRICGSADTTQHSCRSDERHERQPATLAGTWPGELTRYA